MVTVEEIREMALRGEDVTKLDVSHITDMSGMFQGLVDFNQDISGWDVSNVSNMNYLFKDCHSFNQDLSKWNTSTLTYSDSMFKYCTSFDQDLSKWDIRHFRGMNELVQIFNTRTNSMDTKNYTHAEEMLKGCRIREEFKPRFK